MATIDAGDILKVVVELLMPEGVIAQLVQHYRATQGSGGDPDAVLGGIQSNLSTAWSNIAGRIASGVDAGDMYMYKYNPGANQYDGVAINTNGIGGGTAGGQMLPHQDAVLVSFYGEDQKRTGRKYIPGLEEPGQEDGLLDGTYVVNFVNFALQWDNLVVAGGITVVPGTFNTDETSPLYQSFSDATGTIGVDTVLASMDKRKIGQGI